MLVVAIEIFSLPPLPPPLHSEVIVYTYWNII